MSFSKSPTFAPSTQSQVIRFLRNLLIFCILLFIGLEISVRVLGHSDVDGQFSVLGVDLPPYALHIKSLEQSLSDYGPEGNSRFVYDAAAGYAMRPNWIQSSAALGVYGIYNVRGIRAPSTSTEFTLEPADSVLRIALFGDSFTLGDMVPYEDSWGQILEQELKDRGINAEVITFGVSGYNLAQSLRHYETLGVDYHSDIVLLGFRAESHIEQTLDMIPALESHGASPFSEPRYILQDAKLTLINNPTLSPEQVIAILKDPESNPLKNYETQPPESGLTKGMYNSRFLTLLVKAQTSASTQYVLSDDHVQVALATIDAFSHEAEAAGSHFMLMNLVTPQMQQNYLSAGIPAPYEDVLSILQNRYDTVDLQPLFTGAYTSDDWVNGHYSRTAGLRIAPFLADRIVNCVNTPTCSLPRYKH